MLAFARELLTSIAGAAHSRLASRAQCSIRNAGSEFASLARRVRLHCVSSSRTEARRARTVAVGPGRALSCTPQMSSPALCNAQCAMCIPCCENARLGRGIYIPMKYAFCFCIRERDGEVRAPRIVCFFWSRRALRLAAPEASVSFPRDSLSDAARSH